jgi:hypothetical protein
MSYHSTVFTNKEIRKHFSREMLHRLQLVSIIGKPAKTKNQVKWDGDKVTVFGSDFVAKLILKDRVVTNE